MEKFELVTKAASEKLSRKIVKELWSKNAEDTKIWNIRDLLEEYPKVNRIDLKKVIVEDAGIHTVAQSIRKSKTVNSLDFCRNLLHKESCQYLAEIMGDKQVITKIQMGLNPIGDSGMEFLMVPVKNNRRIRELHFPFCELSDRAAIVIAEAIKEKPYFTRLDLSRNKIGGEGGRALGEGLAGNKVLIELNLSNNDIGEVAVTDLCLALEGNDTMKKLYLSKCIVARPDSAEEEAPPVKAAPPAKGGKGAPVPEHEDEGDEGHTLGHIFARFIRNKIHMTDLYLDYLLLKDEYFTFIAQSFRENNAINRLDFRGNLISNEGCKALMEVFNDKDYILEVDLRENKLREEAHQLLEILRKQQPFLWIQFDPYDPAIEAEFEEAEKLAQVAAKKGPQKGGKPPSKGKK